MNVAELIEELKGMDPELEVHFQYNYGDHWRTQVAPKIDFIDMGFVKYSDYHRMDKVADVDYDEEPEDGIKAVVLIG